MIMEIIAAAVGGAFIVLVVFLILALQRLRKLAKKTEHLLTETHHLLRSISEPGVELIHNTNKARSGCKEKIRRTRCYISPALWPKKR